MEQQEVLFRRMPHPGLGLVDHATRIGVRLKSSALLPAGTRDVTSRLSQRSSAHNTSMTSRAATRTPLSSRARKSPQRIAAPNTPPVTYIHNIVVPLNAPMDEMNLVSTTNTQAFSGTRARSTMVNRRGKSQSPVSTVQNSTVRSYSAASAQGDTQDASTVHAEATSIGRDASQWNRSEQASRFASGQESVSLSRTRKRTSEACSTAGFTSYDDPNEIQPHRVDRAYYMSGTNLSLRNRYIVDESELSQLKEMATARRQAKQYGRGLSHLRSFNHPVPVILERPQPDPPDFPPSLSNVSDDPPDIQEPIDNPQTLYDTADDQPEGLKTYRSCGSVPYKPYRHDEVAIQTLNSPRGVAFVKQGFHPKLKLKTRLQLPSLMLANLERANTATLSPVLWETTPKNVPVVAVQYSGKLTQPEIEAKAIKNNQFTPYRYRSVVRESSTQAIDKARKALPPCQCWMKSGELSFQMPSQACGLCMMENMMRMLEVDRFLTWVPNHEDPA